VPTAAIKIIDKILNHLQAQGFLPPPPELLPATRAGLADFRLACIALGFYASLHGTATEGKVAWRPVA
jgi:hypothetical protein